MSANREAGYDEEKEASNFIEGKKSGYQFDLHNIPGKVRMTLVRRGEIDNPFNLPANMPGAKLAKLRAEHKERLGRELAKTKAAPEVGMYVEVGKNNNAFPIIEVDDEYVYFEKTVKKTGETKKFRVAREKARIVSPRGEGNSQVSDDEDEDINEE